MAVMVSNNLITTIQVNMLPPAQISPELLLLNFLAINLPSQPFIGGTFDFTTFSPYSYFKRATPFLQLRCFCIDITFNYINNPAEG